MVNSKRLEVLRSNLPKLTKPVMRSLRSNGVFSVSFDRKMIDKPLKYMIPDYTPPGCVMTYNNAVDLFNEYFFKDRVAWYLAVNCNQSEYDRKGRLRKRIAKLFTKPCIFVTLTFNDDALKRTSEKSRRIEVARFCKNNGSDFVANIDYGNLYDREHYHAIIQSDMIDCKEWNERFGFTYAEDVRLSEKSSFLMEEYIDKLTQHSLKSNGTYARLIYSRSKKNDKN